jgi:hypothetical protein
MIPKRGSRNIWYDVRRRADLMRQNTFLAIAVGVVGGDLKAATMYMMRVPYVLVSIKKNNCQE